MNIPNLVFVPVTINLTVVDVANSAARRREPRPQPFNASPTQAPE